jgi:hypothetical protein
MSRLFLDSRTARATRTVMVILGVIGLAYAVRGVLLLIALSLFFAYLLFPVVRLTQQRVVQRRSWRSRSWTEPLRWIWASVARRSVRPRLAGHPGLRVLLSIPVIAAARIVWRRLPTPTALSVDDRGLERPVASPRQL